MAGNEIKTIVRQAFSCLSDWQHFKSLTIPIVGVEVKQQNIHTLWVRTDIDMTAWGDSLTDSC